MNDKTKDTQSKWLEIQKRINVHYANDEATKWRIVARMREMMTHRFTTTFKRWWDDEIERKRRLHEQEQNRKPTIAENIILQRKVSRPSRVYHPAEKGKPTIAESIILQGKGKPTIAENIMLQIKVN